MKKFIPSSPDKFLKNEEDMSLAKFGHINALAEAVTTVEENVTTLQSEVEAIPSAPLYLEVDITPTTTTYSDGRPALGFGILGMGDDFIPLTPPSSGTNYPQIQKISFEYTFITSDYVLAGDTLQWSNGFSNVNIAGLITDYGQDAVFSTTQGEYSIGASPLNAGGNTIISMFTTDGGDNPTGGDGTIKVKVWYTMENFG